jgi:hypothetical protein
MIGFFPSGFRSLSFKDRAYLRNWWFQILRDYGRYPCYAFFLLLPADKEAYNYLTENTEEINLLSGNSCLVLIICGQAFFITTGGDETFRVDMYTLPEGENYSNYIKKLTNYVGSSLQRSMEYSPEIARYFEIPFDLLPCMVIFKDIRTPEHVVVDLRNMNENEISMALREVFSIIDRAVSKGKYPLRELRRNRKLFVLQQEGKSIISEVRVIAEKTIEKAMEAWFKSLFPNP